ncbi:sporulation initiation inhibitor Soj [candidate division KD3-62 bacterium DG_56]|uniref:Sporulation initiation inhibitor Soj n=1 Tax=candidate division KD3-62 bacterium DG_56 TaxID=1704032 RepID=A0A0S7XR41_9BACT|nr:MAG: sporulation initiation inhibitor Soj [candidate division KD3-62 bacterium DG_56]
MTDDESVSRETTRRVIAVVNQKGGVGKTTTAINLGAALAASGERVLLVDVDPQGNSTTGLGIPKASLDGTIYDVLRGERTLDSVARPTGEPGLEVIPATIDLAGAEVELASALARERKLAAALETLSGEYAYALLDTPPSLGLLTVNCLTCADEVLIPIQCEYYALEGLAQLMQTMHLVSRHLNPGLRLLGVLLTMHDARTRLSEDVATQVRSHFPAQVFATVIPRTVRLSEAPSHGQPIITYDGGSRAARAYTELAKEVMARGDEKTRTGITDPWR